MSAGSRTGGGEFDIRSSVARDFARSIEPLVIISADSHVAPPPEDYLPYFDRKHRRHFTSYLSDMRAWHALTDGIRRYPSDLLDLVDSRKAFRTGGQLGYVDPDRRLRETTAEGVVAELLHPGGDPSTAPFFVSIATDGFTEELRAAGAVAHNRFLTEFCSAAPDRLIGVYLTYPWPDMQAAAQMCVDAREAGARAVFPAQQAGVVGDPCPPLFDRSWDPFWGACVDLGLVVHFHAGFGRADGSLGQALEGLVDLADVFETFPERRSLWQLMWGGVFDRFPRLKVAFVELHADWVPATLAYLDQIADRSKSGMLLRPTEYWERHCWVGASLLRRGEVESRHEIGLNKLMFGTDYPHPEGTWPNTSDWIRATLGHIPTAEARQILGENAIEFYGLDGDWLRRLAKRYGPYPGEILETPAVDPALLDHFHARGGIAKEADLHLPELRVAVDEDIARAAMVPRPS